MNKSRGFLPPPPVFADELVDECRRDGDFRPILFEWYKYVSSFCGKTACLAQDSPAIRPLPRVHYAVLIGLLNRCSRLMVANLRLSSSGRYGETTRLLDRCIAESAVKIRWLCQEDHADRFDRYVADALKKDVLLKELIYENVRKRGGARLVIEERMLGSVQHCITLGGLSESDIRAARKLPDFASMCHALDLDDLFYLAIQRLGSHAVHGTWTDLVLHYLCDGGDQPFSPRDHNVETQDVQYIVVSRLVLAAIASFFEYVSEDADEAEDLASLARDIEEELVKIQNVAWRADFGEADASGGQ